jgi:hypothetical protein
MIKKQKYGMLAGDLLNLLLLLLNLRKLLLKKVAQGDLGRKWLDRRYFGRGLSNLLFEELVVEDKESFKNFIRMSTRTFDDLLSSGRKNL